LIDANARSSFHDNAAALETTLTHHSPVPTPYIVYSTSYGINATDPVAVAVANVFGQGRLIDSAD
jgi:hypothetical protein